MVAKMIFLPLDWRGRSNKNNPKIETIFSHNYAGILNNLLIITLFIIINQNRVLDIDVFII